MCRSVLQRPAAMIIASRTMLWPNQVVELR
jgi:hypothetical protein